MAAAPRSDARASSPSSVKPDVAGAEPSFEGADIRAAIEQYEKDVLRAASCCAVLGCIRVNVVEPGKALEQQMKKQGMLGAAASDDSSDDEDGGAAAAGGTAAPRAPKAKPSAGKPATDEKDKEEDKKEEDKEDEKVPPVPCCRLFRFADACDWAMIVIGIMGGVGFGCVQPLFAILFGDLLNSFGAVNLSDAVGGIAINFLYLGLGAFVGVGLQFGLLAISAERQVLRMRKAYVEALLRQPMSFWDGIDPGTVTSRLSEDTLTVARGIGDQMGVAANSVAATLAGIIVGFYFNPLLALVVVAFVPAMAIPIAILVSSRTSFETITSDAYARASAVSTEALAAIRTVAAFGSERAESRRYSRHVGLAERVIAGSGLILGSAQALFWVFIMGAYAAGLYFGATQIIASRENNPLCSVAALVATNAAGTEDCFSGGDVILVFFAVLTGAFTAGQAGPAVSAFAAARVAARPIFEAIDSESPIDPLPFRPLPSGKAPSAASTARSVKPRVGKGIEFVDVGFCYPSQPGVFVLRGFNLHVPVGQTVALVGPSGSGKSSAMQLLLRYYDPSEGAIFVNGKDIRDMPVHDLRASIGFVQQQPKLFNTTVAENVAFGLTDYRSDHGEVSRTGIPIVAPDTLSRVREATKAASALRFVEALPEGFDTVVGNAGSTLSGGQRQRICIARAVIRKPDVLLLDEATSALDTKSEGEVQRAIDKLLSGEAGTAVTGSDRLTAIVIAHRLATVRGSDKIVVVNAGSVEDEGTHAELIARGGRYAQMNDAQRLGTEASAATTADGAVPAGGAAPEDAAAAAGAASAASVAVGGVPGGSPATATALAFDGPGPLAFRKVPVLKALHDRLSFGAPGKEVGTTGCCARPRPDGPEKPLSWDSQEVISLCNALAEMTTDEREAALSWWLGDGYDAAKGDEEAAILPGVVPVALPPSKAMVDEAFAGDLKLEDMQPRAEPTFRTLFVTPVASRNRMLGMLLTASVPPVSMWQVLKYQRTEAFFFVSGVIGCAIAGSVFPVQSVIFAFVLDALFLPDNDQLLADATVAAGLFVLVGVVAGVGFILQYGSFEYIGAKLTSRMRKQVYSAILRQDMSYHDYPFNSVGRLTARLASDAAMVRRSTGERLGLVVQGGTGLIVALALAFAASWQLTLVVLAIGPIIGAVGLTLNWAVNGSTSLVKESLEALSASAYEASANIRTVTALGMEHHVLEQVDRAVRTPLSLAVRIGITNGIAQGLLQLVLFGSYGIVFYVGSLFIQDGLLEFEGLTRVFFVLSFAALSSSSAQDFAGDQAKAESAKRSAFAVFARKTRIDAESDAGLVPEGGVKGRIEFRDVWFAYPARPEVWALRGLNLTVEPGQQVGICGESGSGKSTVIQLALRFFDPSKGQVLLDGVDLREYNVRWLRSQMGLVQQQPELFSDTVMYNILYGNVPEDGAAAHGGDAETGTKDRPGLEGNKPLAELGLGTRPDGSEHPDATAAARVALAHRFTMRKPFKYATPAGVGGTQALSGGQAQRVAIARALIRAAPIFLADEATSALDSVSERKVQRALEHVVSDAKEKGINRTSLVIAHRLSTIRDSDTIVLLDKGKLIEQGTHAELIAIDGSRYRELAVAQDGAEAADA